MSKEKSSGVGKAYLFEQNMKRLEEIVKQLADPQVPLMEGFKLYEEGMALSQEMRKVLKDVEQKVRVIQKKSNGWSEEEFEPEQNPFNEE